MRSLWLLFIAFPLFAQEQITFNLGYQANSVMTIDTKTIVDVEMSLEGDKNALPRNVRNHFPVKMINKSLKVQTVATGTPDRNGQYSIESYINKDQRFFSLNGADMVETTADSGSMEGLKITGSHHANGDVIFLSADGVDLTEELKNSLVSSFAQLHKGNALNHRSVKVGESLSLKAPLVVPAGVGKTLSIDMNITYILNSIDNGIAKFTVAQQAEMKKDLEAGTLIVVGTGEGTMQYDVEKSYITESNTNMLMDMLIPNSNFYIRSQSASTTVLKTSYEFNAL
ncbi:hypothetical protein [Photobacterium sanguinicancri]|uniref:hypothetical protein n=1 Tax=Photobacterium sanguinicancri TaxID=875932 RepID=UPI0026E21550|nr:hypothetical protein [Photobacterium sanguinicancri]MDO6498160.1 hypothetical protein [Photobacterium sanguinicancri]